MVVRKPKEDMTYITYERNRNKYLVRVPGCMALRFEDKEEAIKKRDVLREMMQNKQIRINSSITVKEWLEYWLNRYCGDLTEKTRQDYQDLFRNHCTALYRLRMVDVKPFDINDIIMSMVDKKVAHSTIVRTRAALSSAFNRVKSEGLIEYNRVPTDGIKIPKQNLATKDSEYIRKAYPQEVLEKLVEVAKQYCTNKRLCQRYTAALLILTKSGMRLSELLGLCKKDVTEIGDDYIKLKLNQSTHQVDKKRSHAGKAWTVDPLKSKASYREITIIDKDLVPLAQELIEGEHPLVRYEGKDYDFLFATRTGTPILKSNFYRDYNKIRKIVGQPIRIHEIRHSVATILAAEPTIPFANSAAFLGHSKEVFLKYYVHPVENKGLQIAQTLAKRHSGADSDYPKDGNDDDKK